MKLVQLPRAVRHEFGPMLRVALPLVIAEIGWMAMGIEDTFMLGRLPNSAVALGASGIGGITFYTVAICGSAVLLGLDALVSQAYGAGDVPRCHEWLVDGLWLALLLTPPMMLLLALAIPALRMIGVNADVLAATAPFLNVLNWSTLPLALYFALRRYLQAIGISAPVTWTLLSANAVNLLGNYVFIFGKWGAPRLGVIGSAFSTLLARCYMALALAAVVVYFDRKRGSGLFRVRRRASWGGMRELFFLGLPAAAQIGVELAVFALATALVGKLSPTQLAAHQIVLNTASLTFMVPLGISSAVAVRVGHALGRKHRPAAAIAGWTAFAMSLAFMTCSAVVLVALPGAIARLYTPNEAVIAATVPLFAIAAAFQLFDGTQVTMTGALRGAGETRSPMFANLGAYWLMGLPLGYWLCFQRHWQAAGIWAGLCIGLVVVGVVLLIEWWRLTAAWDVH